MKTKIDWFKHIVILISLLALPALGFAQDVHPEKKNVKPPKKEYYSFVGDHFPNQVFFGDTHVHTSWSTDAGMIGVKLGPDEAYRFAKGEEVT